MYDFLMSEEWWMEAIIIAIITTIGTVLVAVIGYNYKIKSIYKNSDKMLDEHKDLSSAHKGLSFEHKDLSSEHKEILFKQQMNIEKTKDTYDILNTFTKEFQGEKAKSELRHANLSEKQKDMLTVVETIKAMGEEIKSLSLELKEQRMENEKIQEENKVLKAEKQLKQDIQTQKKPRGQDFER